MSAVVSPEIWHVKRICDLVRQQRILPTVSDRLDGEEVLSFFDAIRARQSLGTVILSEVAGGGPVGYTIVDGRYRIEAIARVLCPEQFAQGESVQVHLTPFDRGGALAWGPTGGDPSALPLAVLTSTRQFGRWEAELTRYEKDPARAKRVLNDAHAAARMLDTPVLAYIVRGADRDDLDRLANQANSRFRLH